MSNDDPDVRKQIYDDLHHRQILEERTNHYSAATILGLLFRHIKPVSICDIGCGIGIWLRVANELDVKDTFGIEGPWLDRSLLCVPQETISIVDFEQPFALGRRFDLLICVEVAEHLSNAAAAGFVGSLANHSDLVLFSAAIPFQGGHHHLNERYLDYWEGLFLEHDFVPVDFIRREIWKDSSIHWWLRQNILVFAKSKLATEGGPLAGLRERNGPLSIVHPEVYQSRMQTAQRITAEYQQLRKLLSSGSVFSVQKEGEGNLIVTRMQ